jgi:putative transposase
MEIIHKKRVRLRNFDYRGLFRYFVTICAYGKDRVFKNDLLLVSWLTEALREKSTSFGFRVWAYCFMPDHLHLLIEGKDNNSDMRRFLSAYKQSTGFCYKKKTGLRLWQVNDYEQVLRKEEDTTNVARYIFDNPVRKGLVDDFKKYKFLGSFEFDLFTL